jgi:ribonuclease Z
MQTVLRYLAGLAGLFLLFLGLMFLLRPGSQAIQFAVFPSGNGGLSTLRADLGGPFIGMGLFALMGAFRGRSSLLAVPASFLGLIVFGRLLNLMLDGSSPIGARSLLIEVILGAILLAAALVLQKPKRSGRRLSVVLPTIFLILIACAWIFQRPIGLQITKRNIERGMQNQLIPSLPDGLHVGLCGSGSPLADPSRSGPCVFVIAGKRLYLIDTGDGAARKLALMGIQPGLIDGVFLTHFHSDHIAGLGDVFIQRWGGASHTERLPVYGPQGVDTVVAGFNEAYSLDKEYRVLHHGPAAMPPPGNGGVAHPFVIAEGSDTGQVVLQADGLTVTAFPVNHAPVFPAVGYRFDYKGRSVVVSGDTAPSPVLTHFATGVDVLFHEGLQPTMVADIEQATRQANRMTASKIMHDIPSYHTSPEDAARIAAKAGVGQLVIYHVIPPIPLAYMNAAFLGDASRIFPATSVSTDGLMISLLPGSRTITRRDLL